MDANTLKKLSNAVHGLLIRKTSAYLATVRDLVTELESQVEPEPAEEAAPEPEKDRMERGGHKRGGKKKGDDQGELIED